MHPHEGGTFENMESRGENPLVFSKCTSYTFSKAQGMRPTILAIPRIFLRDFKHTMLER